MVYRIKGIGLISEIMANVTQLQKLDNKEKSLLFTE